MFFAAIPQLRYFGDLACLSEDWVERFHQYGKKLNAQTARMGSFQKQQDTQIKLRWAHSNPEVEMQIADVNKRAKRKFKDETEKVAAKKRKELNKRDVRDQFIMAEIAKLNE